MAAYSLLVNIASSSNRTNSPSAHQKHHKGQGRLTKAQVDRALQGNLCRCTGYRPILEALYKFTAEAEQEVCATVNEGCKVKTCPRRASGTDDLEDLLLSVDHPKMVDYICNGFLNYFFLLKIILLKKNFFLN
jgi:hypothetical protein